MLDPIATAEYILVRTERIRRITVADDTQQRAQRVTWPWIIGLVIAALVAGLLFRGHRARTGAPGADPGSPGAIGARPAAGALGAYLVFVDEREAQPPSSREHEVIAVGITRLADAIEEVGRREEARVLLVREPVERMRRLADSLQVATTPAEQSRLARAAFGVAAAAMERMQAQGFPTLEALRSEVSAAAAGVEAERSLAEQREAVTAFFRRAASLLRNMAPQAV